MRKNIYDPKDYETVSKKEHDSELTGKIQKYLTKYQDQAFKPSSNAGLFAFDDFFEKYNPTADRMDITNQRILHEIQGPCHGSMQHIKRTCQALVNVVHSSGIRESAKGFLELLLSPKGPYRDALENITILRDKEDDFPKIVIWRQFQNDPIQLVASYCIATRLHSCWGASNLWDYLVKQGVDKIPALLLASAYHGGGHSAFSRLKKFEPKENKIYPAGYQSGDMPFTPGNFSSVRFAQGDYRKDRVSPTKENSSSPTHCNYLWDYSNDQTKKLTLYLSKDRKDTPMLPLQRDLCKLDTKSIDLLNDIVNPKAGGHSFVIA